MTKMGPKRHHYITRRRIENFLSDHDSDCITAINRNKRTIRTQPINVFTIGHFNRMSENSRYNPLAFEDHLAKCESEVIPILVKLASGEGVYLPAVFFYYFSLQHLRTPYVEDLYVYRKCILKVRGVNDKIANALAHDYLRGKVDVPPDILSSVKKHKSQYRDELIMKICHQAGMLGESLEKRLWFVDDMPGSLTQIISDTPFISIPSERLECKRVINSYKRPDIFEGYILIPVTTKKYLISFPSHIYAMRDDLGPLCHLKYLAESLLQVKMDYGTPLDFDSVESAMKGMFGIDDRTEELMMRYYMIKDLT